MFLKFVRVPQGEGDYNAKLGITILGTSNLLHFDIPFSF